MHIKGKIYGQIVYRVGLKGFFYWFELCAIVFNALTSSYLEEKVEDLKIFFLVVMEYEEDVFLILFVENICARAVVMY